MEKQSQTNLTRAIKSYIESRPAESVQAVASRCKLPRSAIDNIFRKHLPEPGRLSQLLTGVDDLTACDWLEAYLRDHIPLAWRDRTHVRVSEAQGSRLQEVPPTSAPVKDRFSDANDWLQNRVIGDDDLAEWFIETINLLRGLHSKLEQSMENTDAAISLALGKPYSTADLEEPATPFTPDETALLAAAERQAAADSLGGTPGKPTPARKPLPAPAPAKPSHHAPKAPTPPP